MGKQIGQIGNYTPSTIFLLYLKTVAWDREKNYKEITETQIKKQGK